MRWHLVFAVTGFTRSHPQPSARFPWIDYQSRNRSPPLELSNAGRPGRIPRRDLRYPIGASSPTVIGPAAGEWPGCGMQAARRRGRAGRRNGPQGRHAGGGRERAAGAACRGGGGGNGPQVRHAGAEAAGTGRRCGMQGRGKQEEARWLTPPSGPSGIYLAEEEPPWALAVAERWRPRGSTGRVGAGPEQPGLPRDEARSPHGDWAATPQAAPQSLRKTSERSWMVAPRYQKAGNDGVTNSPVAPGGILRLPEPPT